MTHYYCTMADRDYLTKTLALHESLERYCRPYHLWVLTLDEQTQQLLRALRLPRITTMPLTLLEAQQPLLPAAKVSHQYWHCYVWTCKSHWIYHLLTEYHLKQLYYIDSDAYFFHDPTQMYQDIGNAQIAFTKHNFSHKYAHCECNGTYNGGFLYVRNKPIVLQCLSEWSKVCRKFRYGPLTDQIHFNIWPQRWPVHVIKHIGVNVAPWNYERYKYNVRDSRVYMNGASPLIWYHFHKGLRDDIVSPIIANYVYQPYANALARAQTKIAEVNCKL